MIDSLPSLSNLKKLVKVVIKENFRKDLSNILIKLVQIEEEEFKFKSANVNTIFTRFTSKNRTFGVHKYISSSNLYVLGY